MTNLRHLSCAVLLLIAVPTSHASEPPADVLTGTVATRVVERGDTLQTLAARAGVDVATVVADSGLTSAHALASGQPLVIDNRHIVPVNRGAAAIVVNLPQRMLFFFDRTVVGLPVAVGRRTWSTPLSEFQVVTLETDPTWDVPASIRAEAQRLGRTLPASVPPGPANPLGRFWIGLSGGAVGIHGTNAPSSIYGAVTHGCMRLHPDDIAWLFPRVSTGMTVRTVYEPVLLADIGGRVFLEVHPDVYRRQANALAAVQALAADRGLTGRIDWAAAARVVALRHGVARDVTSAEPPERHEVSRQ
jgi:L,D-transpeptidase ErfK/SrfK